MFVVVMALVCGASASPTVEASLSEFAESRSESVLVEAGVVQSDRDGYLCCPFEQIGLSNESSVASVTSSCECVRPRIVTYRTPMGSESPAIFLDYVADTEESKAVSGLVDEQPTAMNLGVIVKVELVDGAIHQFIVKLLHTTLVEEVLP